MIDANSLKLYAVTDRTWLNGRSLFSVCEETLQGGATILQLREKRLSQEDFLQEGREIQQLCQKYHVPFIINDNVMIAKELGAGLHVGQSDMELLQARKELGPDALIGVSCQTVEQALQAERNGADYLGVGAVFPTGTKKDADAVSLRTLAAICSSVKIPVVAIGGISLQNLPRLAGIGLAGAAVVSALFAAPNPKSASQVMNEKLTELLAQPPQIPAGGIVDMDGTILDSLPYWENLGIDYLRTKGKTSTENLRAILNTMELPDAASYLKKNYGLEESVDQIVEELLAAVRSIYLDKVTLFPGAAEWLKEQHDRGVRLMLFTANGEELARKCLQRCGVLPYFDRVLSTLEIGYGKHEPEAYWAALGYLGTSLHHTTVYEDADYAVKGATQSGMKVITLPFAQQARQNSTK